MDRAIASSGRPPTGGYFFSVALLSVGNALAYGRAVTLTYDEALREQVRSHLSSHDRRNVADPKRHAAVAVVLVDSEVGDDRVDPAPVDDWNAGWPTPPPASTAAWSMCQVVPLLLCRRASRLSSHAAQWALPGGGSTRARPDRRRVAGVDEESVSVVRLDHARPVRRLSDPFGLCHLPGRDLGRRTA